MLKAYKYRLYPNLEQREYLVKTFGCTRFIYNKMLADKIECYKETGEMLKNTPAQYKKEFEWLKEVDSLALANAQQNLEKAYKNFFRDKSIGFPKFKSKKTNYYSYTTNNHSVFKLSYHLVLVIKYRRKVIDDDISNRLKEIFEYISPKYNITLEEWNHDKDHVHLLFRGSQSTKISKFLNAYKSASSRLIKKEYPIIRKQLWKEYFWSRSYCLLTTGGEPIEVVRKCIENQGGK